MLAGGDAAASWDALGTSVRLVVDHAPALRAARHAVEDLLAAVDAAASRFREDSELSRLAARAGRWQEISPLFATLLRAALDAADFTEGLLDPTVGEALRELGYDRTFRLVAETGAPLAVRVGRPPGPAAVELDEANLRARLRPGAFLDLGATAKGLASDLAAAAARDAAGAGVLVSLGGDIAVAGPAPGAGWPVRISDFSDPERATGEGQTILVAGGGLATSSVAARRWARGGSVYHHIIDPRTGVSATGPWRTVSVTAASCLAANVASTTAVILGAEAPGWLARNGYPARLVRHDGGVVKLGGWP